MMKLSALLLLSFLLACEPTAALAQSHRIDFKGVPMGISLDELKTKLSLDDMYCTSLDKGTNTCWTSSVEFTYAGQIVRHFSAEFIDDGLASVTVKLLGGTGNIAEQALVARYGRPQSRSKVSETLKNGAKYQMTSTKWKLSSGDEISIQDHPKPVQEVFISLSSSSWVQWRQRAQKASSKEKLDI